MHRLGLTIPGGHRYTDFLVNEILPSGEVLHLRSLKAPKASGQSSSSKAESAQVSADRGKHTAQLDSVPAAPRTSNEEDSGTSELPEKFSTQALGMENSEMDSSKSTFDVMSLHCSRYRGMLTYIQPSAEDEALLESFFGKEITKGVIDLHRRVIRSPQAKPRDLGNVVSDVINDRGLRTKIHEALRRIFASRLDSFTNANGAMDISAAPPRSKQCSNRDRWGRGRAPNQPQGKLGWNDLGGEYLHFSIYKENKDTMEVISFIARALKLNPRSFQFAGTKDRRGVTVQRASVFRVFADRLAATNRTLRNSAIGDYKYEIGKLSLGDSSGNEFVITLRECALSTGPSSAEEIGEAVKALMESVQKNGFINYYGLQRFGTFSTRTDTVGLFMLKGDFKAACDAILHYEAADLAENQDSSDQNDYAKRDSQGRADAIHIFQITGNASAALNKLPRKFSAEVNVIQHLGRPGNGNDFYGALQMIPRNARLMYVHAYQSLVWNYATSQRWKLFGDKVVEGDLVMIDERNEPEHDEVDADGEVVIHPSADDSATTQEDMFPQARPLTAEDAASGDYSIFDVVLPLPGYDVVYPKNEMTDFYKLFMASEQGGGLDPFDMRRKWKDVSLSGSYRKILGKAGGDCSAEAKTYVRDDEQFVQTDLDILKGSGKDSGKNEDSVAEETGEGRETKTAVVLKFQLGSSQYATMALRELMKGGAVAYKHDFGGGK
jgi:tRNA pseudouridine13 synthase